MKFFQTIRSHFAQRFTVATAAMAAVFGLVQWGLFWLFFGNEIGMSSELGRELPS